MSDEVTAALRQLVFGRAGGKCEYCLLPQSASAFPHEPDHIVPLQHDGQTTADNLALACPYCNRFKGTDLGSLDPETNQLVPFYNPRRQSWTEHFRREGAWMVPLTAEGRVTVAILQLNHPDRVLERQRLLEAGLL